MSTMVKKDYLEDLAMPATVIFDSPLIQQEIQRVKSHNLLEEPVVVQLPHLDIDTADISQLKSFNEKANTIHSYNSVRQINLELMLKYGLDSHKIFIDYLNNFKTELHNNNSKLRYQIDEIN